MTINLYPLSSSSTQTPWTLKHCPSIPNAFRASGLVIFIYRNLKFHLCRVWKYSLSLIFDPVKIQIHLEEVLLLLLLSRFSRVRLCATPQMAAHQAPPSLGFSRQEHWVAISFSSAWKWKVKVKSLSRVRRLVTPWTAAHQAPLSMGFSRWERWSGVPSPSPGNSSAIPY